MVDTNIIVDLIEGDGRWYEWSREALAGARVKGSVIASAIVLGELASRAARFEELVKMLATFGVACTDLSLAAAHRAGLAQLAYRVAGGQREKLLGDFVIGAHAEILHAALLTRDPRRYRLYFPDLILITPETDNG